MLAIGVVFTWAVFAAIFILAGAWSTLLFRGFSTLGRLRIAMWIGLAEVVILLIALNFFAPLQSSTTFWIVALLGALSIGVWIARRG